MVSGYTKAVRSVVTKTKADSRTDHQHGPGTRSIVGQCVYLFAGDMMFFA